MAAAQRNVDVVAEPARQRDMPAPPVFADGAGKIRILKVFRQRDAEELTDADGHIAVAGKVKIQLHHVGRVAQREDRCGQRGRRDRRDFGVNQSELVGDDGLFCQAQHEPLDAVAEAVRRDAARLAAGVQLRGLLAVPHDGPGWPVAEEREKHRKTDRVLFRFHLARGHIGTVADGREHVKAQPQRQGGGEHRQQTRYKGVDRLRRKARIFKAAQHRQIQQDQQNQQRPFVGQPPQRKPAQPVDTGQQHQDGRAL